MNGGKTFLRDLGRSRKKAGDLKRGIWERGGEPTGGRMFLFQAALGVQGKGNNAGNKLASVLDVKLRPSGRLHP